MMIINCNTCATFRAYFDIKNMINLLHNYSGFIEIYYNLFAKMRKKYHCFIHIFSMYPALMSIKPILANSGGESRTVG